MVAAVPRTAHAASLTVCAAGPPDCDHATVAAALAALAGPGPHTITLAAETFVESGIVVNIDAAVTIQGAGMGVTVIDGTGAARLIDLQNAGAASSLTLRDLTLRGGTSPAQGAAVRADADLTVQSVAFESNTSDDRGGAIYSNNGVALVITDSVFTGNYGDVAGGAIQPYGSLLVERSLFGANSTSWGGNSIDLSAAADGPATVRDSAFVGHAAGNNIASNAPFTVEGTWWGDATGPVGKITPGNVTSNSHATLLDVVTSDASPTVGDSVTVTATPVLSPGGTMGTVTVQFVRTGANPGTDVVTGAGSASITYSGVVGADSITATVLWGGLPGPAPLSGATIVDWAVPPPPPPPPSPVASAGGPYEVVEGGSVVLDASGSSVSALPATYAWTFEDGSSVSGVAASRTYEDDGVLSVSVLVTDGLGRMASASATVTVTNAAPEVRALPEASGHAGSAVALMATFTDAGRLDAPWTYRVGWGDGQVSTGSVEEPGTISQSASYATAGTYEAQVCVTDKDGDEGCATVLVTVTAAPSTPTPTPTPPPVTATPVPPAASAATPASMPAPADTSTPAASPASPPVTTPTSTPTVAPAASPTPSAAERETPSGIAVGGGAEGSAPSETPVEAVPAPQSLALGAPVAGLLASVDTSRTVGGREVPEDVARMRAEVRKVATVGAAFNGGVVPWYAAQTIDKRAVAGALVSGGAFLPFLFAGGSPVNGGAPGGAPSDGGPGDRRREEDGDE